MSAARSDGDGKVDILFRSTSGNVVIWQMNGLSVTASGIVGFADPANWTIVPPDNTGDISSDAATALGGSAPLSVVSPLPQSGAGRPHSTLFA